MLCLLLPHENRNTMRELLNFFKLVVDLQNFNKMSIHNVSTITAPSFFPPRFVHPTDKNDISAQVRMAAKCCNLTNVLIAQSDNLWMVPQRLIDEAKKINKSGNVRTFSVLLTFQSAGIFARSFFNFKTSKKIQKAVT
jgi:Rho GTPase-activating protein 18/28/40